jgi:hypothetical protein
MSWKKHAPEDGTPIGVVAAAILNHLATANLYGLPLVDEELPPWEAVAMLAHVEEASGWVRWWRKQLETDTEVHPVTVTGGPHTPVRFAMVYVLHATASSNSEYAKPYLWGAAAQLKVARKALRKASKGAV